MRIILAAILLSVCVTVQAVIVEFSATSSVPTTFTVDNENSELSTCPTGPYAWVYNGTASIVDWGVGSGEDSAPLAAAGEIPPGTMVNLQGYVYWDGSDAFYIKSHYDTKIYDGYVILQCAGWN